MIMSNQFALLLVLILTTCSSFSVRDKRQENGEFWWIKETPAAVVTEVKRPEVKIQPVGEANSGKKDLTFIQKCFKK